MTKVVDTYVSSGRNRVACVSVCDTGKSVIASAEADKITEGKLIIWAKREYPSAKVEGVWVGQGYVGVKVDK